MKNIMPILVLGILIISGFGTAKDADDKTTKENHLPYKLWVKSPIEVWVGVEYTFNITIEGLEGDNIFIFIDWGDGNFEDWNGPYESGETIFFTRYWSEIGTYSIKMKARDMYGQQSDWYSFVIYVIPPPRLFMDMEFNGMLNTKPWRGLIFSLINFDKATVTMSISQKVNLEPFTCHDYKFIALALDINSYDKDKLYIDASALLMILIDY